MQNELHIYTYIFFSCLVFPGCIHYCCSNGGMVFLYSVRVPGRIQNMDRGPWTTPWTRFMDHP